MFWENQSRKDYSYEITILWLKFIHNYNFMHSELARTESPNTDKLTWDVAIWVIFEAVDS